MVIAGIETFKHMEPHEFYTLVTAIASTIIALCSLWFSINQAKATRVHNELSVKPVVNVSRNDTGIRVKNKGLGPAKVKSILIVYGGDEHKLDSWDNWVKLFERLSIDPETLGTGVRFQTYLGTITIPAGGELSIINLSIDPPEWFLKLIDSGELKVEYQSIYGQEFKANGRLY